MDFLLNVDPIAIAQFIGVEFSHLVSPQWYRENYAALLQIIMIDVVLAGDNAIIVGLAASRVAPDIRGRVIFWGIAGAVVLRILFASVTTQILAIVGLTLAGGILLLWVCWKMYRQITGGEEHNIDEIEKNLDAKSTTGPPVSFWAAVSQIIVADISMSLDNVLAVAGAAKGEPLVLVVGLAVAIVLMALAAHFIARLLVRYPWITWIGLLIIVYVSLDMIYRGSHEITCEVFNFGCSEDLFSAILHRLGLGPGASGTP
ncbi:integral membrane protein, YjbE family [Filomicrobium insigne]|uniref:Integral membrane protein, YjbE family n=1 Tax=Filomicrobium insigne TaxID=418854 RepID=A0A1H0QKH0_9HYPH|nr:TerC family protein [Filomicrobium insigne]SDP17804.1 integral membrane protein, YjbE family [Filomicrobium insigne]